MTSFSFGEFILWIGSAFSDYKTLVEHSLGFHNDVLHVLVGIGLQIAAAFVFRRTLADWLPLIVVIALEIANEANDLLTEVWPDPAMQAGEGVKDLLLTIVVPLALTLLARYCPGILVRVPRDASDQE